MWLSRNKALIIALIVVGAALGLRSFSRDSIPQVFEGKNKPVLGTPGSEHSHMSMMVVMGGTPINFYQDKYVEKSDYAHFHADGVGGYFIHKHTKGVTLAFFFSTLGWKVASACLTIDTGDQYCSDGTNNLSVYINRKPYPGDLDFYELTDGDKILIDYGTTTPVELMLEANGIPDIPDDLAQRG